MPVKVELTKSDIVVYMHGPGEIEVHFNYPHDAEKWCSERRCTWRSGEYALVEVPEGRYEIVKFDASEVGKVVVRTEEGTIRVVV